MVMVMTESSEGEIDVRGSSSFHCFARDEMTVKGGDCELSTAVAGFDFEFDSEFGLLSLRVWPDSVSRIEHDSTVTRDKRDDGDELRLRLSENEKVMVVVSLSSIV
jgi:hypothetical protein